MSLMLQLLLVAAGHQLDRRKNNLVVQDARKLQGKVST